MDWDVLVNQVKGTTGLEEQTRLTEGLKPQYVSEKEDKFANDSSELWSQQQYTYKAQTHSFGRSTKYRYL